jgi:hypothetical protein
VPSPVEGSSRLSPDQAGALSLPLFGSLVFVVVITPVALIVPAV